MKRNKRSIAEVNDVTLNKISNIHTAGPVMEPGTGRKMILF